MASPPSILPASDRSVLVVFGHHIDVEAHLEVLRLFRALQAVDDARVENLHPAYASLLVSFDPRAISVAEMTALLEERLNAAHRLPLPPSREVEIPVCYTADLGPDLQAVADEHGIDVEEVVRLHVEPQYRVHFLGFSPGFPYLGGMSPRLASARLATPRTRVPAGSVAIGGLQTGIYPTEFPGGWRLIGRTPLPMWRAEPSPWVRLEMGDRVRFRSIGRDEFEALAARSFSDP